MKTATKPMYRLSIDFEPEMYLEMKKFCAEYGLTKREVVSKGLQMLFDASIKKAMRSKK